jgi:nitronate monooxygenase
VSDTTLSPLFESALRPRWPDEYPMRSLTNQFTSRWETRIDALAKDEPALAQLAAAVARNDFDIAPVMTGQVAGLLRHARPAGDIITELAEGAELTLRSRVPGLLGDTS